MIFSRASIDSNRSCPAATALSTLARATARKFDGSEGPWDTSTRPMIKHTVRAGRIVVGLLFLAVGAILSLPLVPGPGIPLILVGLTVLSSEFEWARRLRTWAHAEFDRLTGRRDVE